MRQETCLYSRRHVCNSPRDLSESCYLPLLTSCSLQPPHVDLNLRLIKGIDLLALPLIKEGLRFGIKVRE
jgi:hypothetical protein